eukprot:590857-Rhodomonas_salina.1
MSLPSSRSSSSTPLGPTAPPRPPLSFPQPELYLPRELHLSRPLLPSRYRDPPGPLPPHHLTAAPAVTPKPPPKSLPTTFLVSRPRPLPLPPGPLTAASA